MNEENKQRKKDPNWRDDEFARLEVFAQFWQLSPLIVFAVIAVLAWFFLPLFAKVKSMANSKTVIVYTSQDQVYAEPILKEFEQQTGIKVQAVYDSEAVKTVGLANRLLAERNRPQCDVFWNNEELRTRQLAAQNVFRETNDWDSAGIRTRQLVINTNLLSHAQAPKNLTELTNITWRGKVALAYPLFGTTASHFLVLRQRWGDAHWQAWCRALQANQPFLVDGNSVVVKLVGRGEAWVGLTDSDDVRAAQREGLPVAGMDLKEEGLNILNTIAIVRSAPHPLAAQRLFKYLLTSEVFLKLKAAGAVENYATRTAKLDSADVNWDLLLRELDATTAMLKGIFLR